MFSDQNVTNLLAFLGACVPLMSALASYINHTIRQKQEANEAVSPVMFKAGAALNVGAVNLDKAVQLAKLARKAKKKETTDEG
jgi:hypothetical protein